MKKGLLALTLFYAFFVVSCGPDRTNRIKEIFDQHETAYAEAECGEYCIGTDCESLGECEEGKYCDGNKCRDIKEFNCDPISGEGAEWNTVSSYTQTWNGSEWVPADTATEYNEVSSDTSCRFKCKENYTWNGSDCVADTRTAFCKGLPSNAKWNNVSEIAQTWDGAEWVPSEVAAYKEEESSKECRFKCKINFTWSGDECLADTRTFTCDAKPTDDTTEWNTVSSYTQTWNGSEWVPIDKATEYNEVSSDTSCRFKCKENYTWDYSICAADTKTLLCKGLPSNAEWNNVSEITQTWDGTGWAPSEFAAYNEEESSTECRFKCKINFTWSGDECLADIRTFTCDSKPFGATEWNAVSSYTQTWNGSEWVPVDTTTEYNEASSEFACRFKCEENYTWTDLACVTDTRIFTCDSKPSVATEWNSVSSYTQTWNGSEWDPSDSETDYSTESSTISCRFRCIIDHTWDSTSSTCVISNWTEQCGTDSTDIGRSVAVDSSGNIFVTGWTKGDLDGNTNAGLHDIFLTKWNADGTKAWTKQWGTSTSDYEGSVAVDSSGNIFVTGHTDGSLDGNTNAGSYDIFLTKWNADGTKAWTKQWGTNDYDAGHSVAVDSSGNIFVTGHTDGSLDGNTNAGQGDIFLTKWNSDGTKAWTKQRGTSSYDSGTSVAVDSSGNIFVTGPTHGSLDGNTNAGSTIDVFLTKWNSDGTKAWTKQWGDFYYAHSVAVDSSGSIFVTGDVSPVYHDIFLTKWSADGTKDWTQQWGTSEDDLGYSVAIDSSDNIFVTGYTQGSFDGNTNAGGNDIFLTKWNADGTKAWTKQWGTGSSDIGNSVAADSSGSIFVTGSTQGYLDGNINAGDSDIFLTKWIF